MLIKKYRLMLIVFMIIATMTGCYEEQEKKYYSDKTNFITDEAFVENIIYKEAEQKLVFWLLEIDEAFQDNNFIVKGENVNLLMEKGVLQKIKKGDKITYISAPEYFGDGYAMPIVSIVVGEEELLSFEEGYNNLMKMY